MRPLSTRTVFSVLLVLWSASDRCFGQRRDFEAELISNLKGIANFSPLAYPKLNSDGVVSVTIDTLLGRLVSVDSAKQSVKIAIYMLASWIDERLVWNPDNFGGVDVVNWDSSQIWFPVIMVYNGIGDSQLLAPQIPVFLSSLTSNLTLATASWRREFEFSCSFNMRKFPADEHICELEFFFSSQGRSNSLVQPVKRNIAFDELAVYQRNSEWVMLNATGIATTKRYALVKGYPEMILPTYIFRINIKRVSSYYMMNIIIPILLLTLLQVFVYFVPVESGEKLGFGITIMLSYTVFLLLLDGILPKSQFMPAIATFITAAMILSTISLLLTSLIMRFHFTPEGAPMPACVRAVFVHFLGRLFRVRGAERVDQMPSDMTELSGRKTDDVKTGDETTEEEAPHAAGKSDWILAASAIERLTMALGVLAIAVIIGLFVVKPYA